MSVNTKLEDTIIGAVDTIVNRRISQAGYDKTILATIVSCVDQTTGKYKVKYQDSYWIAYSNNLDNIYAAGSNVYVLIPGGDTSKNKTILGTVQNKKSNYITVMETNDRFIPVGENVILDIISNSEYGLCSYKKSQNGNNNIDEKVLYKQGSGTNSLSIISENAKQYIHNSTSFILGAKIRTDLKPQQRTRGNYGIELKLKFNKADNNSTETETKTYLFDINDMEGNPYFFPNPVRQYAIFELENPSKFDSIESITIFAKDFPNPNDNPSGQEINDIFFSQIEFGGLVYVQNDAFNTQALILRAPKGYIFNQDNGNNDTKDFIPEIWIKGKPINLETQNVKFYWFIQNVSVTDDSRNEKYNKYGKGGWQKLDCQNNKFSVRKNQIFIKQVKYKCVAIYNNIELNKQFKVVRTDPENNITIESSSGIEFYNSVGTTTLTCQCSGKDITTNLTYVWCMIDKTGRKFFLKADDNNENKVNINANTIIGFATYCCSVFKDQGNILLGTASITLTNFDKQNSYSLIIENGNQVFKYNTFGISPASNQNKNNPQTIPALSFKIYDEKGEEINIDNPKIEEITWTIPSNNTLLIFAGESSYSSFNNQTISYSNLLTFLFTIAEQYNFTYTRNNIELKVKYNGLTLYARTNFIFLKQGENGTNGTDFVCKIIPNVLSGDVPVNPTIYYNGSTISFNWDTDIINNKWFKAQLWHNGTEPIFEGTATGSSTEGKIVTIIKWEVLKNVYAYNKSDFTNLKAVAATSNGSWSFSFTPESTFNSIYNSTSYPAWKPANTIKVTLSYDGMTYYAVLPVIVCRIFDNNYSIKLKDYSGFRQVLYNASGESPRYDSHAPFELLTFHKTGNQWEEINEDTIRYDWYYLGSIWNRTINNETQTWVEDAEITNNTAQTGDSSKKWLLKNSTIKTTKTNQKAIKPADNYNGQCVNTALACRVYLNNTTLAWIHIPIHMMRNRFENSAINGWDGNSVNLGGENGGMILAPQVGAGIKDSNNKFTGIFIGTAKDPQENLSSDKNNTSNSTQGRFASTNEDVGLFGYNEGSRSIFLDAKTGKAVFGQKNQAQIILDPTQTNSDGRKVAQIKSGNYNTTNGTGLLIDLSTPQIKYGSENFTVDSNGHLIAKGGGQLAGWQINNNAIFNKKTTTGVIRNSTGMNANPEIDPTSTSINGTGNGSEYRAVSMPPTQALSSQAKNGYKTVGKSAAFWAGGSKFFVTHDGYLKAQQASIGSGSKPIFIGKSSITGSNESAIFSGLKSSKTANKSGFYLGTDGIAIGSTETFLMGTTYQTISNFQVDSDGMLFARKGYIGNGRYGWQIGSNYLRNNKDNISDATKANGVYIGTNGIALGQIYNGTQYVPAFKVTNSGEMTTKKGVIGNWTINKNSISSNGQDYYYTSGTTVGTQGMYFGSGGLRLGANFHVDSYGNLYANNGKFTGEIHATSGKFTGEIQATSGSISRNVTINGTISAGQIVTDTISGYSVKWQSYWVINDISPNWTTIRYSVLPDGHVDVNNLIWSTHQTSVPTSFTITKTQLYLLVGVGTSREVLTDGD